MFFSTPQRAALISVASKTFLEAGKAVVAVLSGSEALHSGLDLLAALFIPPEPCLIKAPQDKDTCTCPLRQNISYPLK